MYDTYEHIHITYIYVHSDGFSHINTYMHI